MMYSARIDHPILFRLLHCMPVCNDMDARKEERDPIVVRPTTYIIYDTTH